jgi:short-chain Z-isoprenyl diphosphate synthase
LALVVLERVRRSPAGSGLRDLVYGLYSRRLEGSLSREDMPQHVGVILDGNRRWARALGAEPAAGHRRGGDKIIEFLGWCEELGIGHVTLWLLSTDNLGRPRAELDELFGIIDDVVRVLGAAERWQVHPVGALDVLPGETVRTLKEVEAATVANTGIVVNIAVGYGGRREIADAVRSLLQEHASRGTSIDELAQVLSVEHIAEQLYTRGQPDPDLVIRTSGEQRLSGFLLWQSAHSEFYFCEAYWPDFRKVDFLRAIREYAARERRFGS